MSDLPIPDRTRRRLQTPVGEKSMTKGSEAGATDVNRIMAKYLKTGVITHWNERRPSYGDFSQASDYRNAMHLTMEAQDAFMALPASVRKLCENDPAVLMDLMGSEAGMQALVKAGLELDDSKKPPAAPPAPPPAEPEAKIASPASPSEPSGSETS